MNAPAHPSQEQTVPRGALDDVPANQQEYPAQLPRFGTIGDDPASHAQAVTFLTRIGQESTDDNRDEIEQAKENALYYRWGQGSRPDNDRVIANDIQTAVISITDIQTRDAYSIFIRPVQTRDTPQVFWIGPPVDERVAMLVPGLPIGLGMEPVIDPMTGQPAMQAVDVPDPMTGAPTGQMAAQPMMQPAQRRDTPMDQVTAWQVRKLAATGAFPAEWLFVLDDKAVADVYQTVFDVFWKTDGIDEFIWEHQLKANIYGYQTASYGWDQARKKHVVRDISIVQARLDAKAEGSSFELQNKPGYEVVYDLDEAKALFPQVADLIEQYAREGNPQRTDSYSQFGTASNRHFRSRTVTFLVHFFRNQVMPMTGDEAVAAGHVYHDGENYRSTQVQEQPDAGMETQGAAQGEAQGLAGGSGTPQLEEFDGPGDESTVPPKMDRSAAGAHGGIQKFGAVSSVGGQSEDRSTGGAGLETSGADGLGNGSPNPQGAAGPVPAPAWPDTTGIRQIATIAQTQRIVQDIRCEHWDIPMLLTVCIGLPSRPYGQGLPEKMRGLQLADIRLLNAVVDYAETFANPGSMIPQTVATAMQKGMKTTHVRPTDSMIMPDDLVEKWGDKAVIWFQPPTLPPAVPQAMQMIDQRTKETSGHPEVMQGVAPSPTSSGKMVEALQNGAAGQFGFLAKSTLRTVERLANLMHYTHLWRLTLEDMCDLYNRIPPELMQLVMDRARKGRWDNTVEANGSAGGSTDKKLNRALSLFAARSGSGEPALTLRTLRDTAGLDDEEESLSYRQELQMAMPTAQPGQPGQPGGAPPDDQNTQETPA